MTYYLRYFILCVSVILSVNSYAADFIRCTVTTSDIPTQVTPGQLYTNVYTCTNYYPVFFPALQLTADIIGDGSNHINVSGTCENQPLRPGTSCNYNMAFSILDRGTLTFNLRVYMGSKLYYLDMPSVTTTTIQSGGLITWPGENSGIAYANTITGTGSGAFSANARDSTGHTVIYVCALSGAGTISCSQNGTFTLSGIDPANPGAITVTATADDATAVPGRPFAITVASSPTITWPGFNRGFASVDPSGDGFGSYVADALDNSGHPVVYTCSLSGPPGTVTCNQNGSFTLNGANGPGQTVTVTATADDAASVPGTPIVIEINALPTKVLEIFNNSTETIWPVIETPIQPIDYWMQAQFAIPNPAARSTHPFTTTRQYRVYVNPGAGAGVPAGESVFISVPFYTNLVAAPSGGTGADEYADWFDAMRVYIYDDWNSLNANGFSRDSVISTYSTAPECLSGSTACTPGTPFPVYAGAVGLPLSDPDQLTEYTFCDVLTNPTPGTFPIDCTHVDYDISSVDQVYLPVAMEPYGNNLVGWNGSIMPVLDFRNILNDFAMTFNWPKYLGTPPYDISQKPRLPGAYNIMIGNQSLTQPQASQVAAALTVNWNSCVATSPLCQMVDRLFRANYAVYAARCSTPTPLTLPYLLQHVYGWVAFDDCGVNVIANPLNATPLSPPDSYAFATDAYHQLQYSGAFNPYVQLIHNPGYLDTQMYAYSIDDAVGNMNEIGNGLVIAVAGSEGLSNPNEYDKDLISTVSPGAWPINLNRPYFSSYGICSAIPTKTLAYGGSFRAQIPLTEYPCQITLRDTNNVLYSFTLIQPPPYINSGGQSTSTYISCTPGDTWCAGVNIDFASDKKVLSTPPTFY